MKSEREKMTRDGISEEERKRCSGMRDEEN